MRKPASIRSAALGAAMLVSAAAHAADYKGVVTFSGLPVPGATVTATRGTEKISVVTGPNGAYTFTNLVDGSWTISVEMLCFASATDTVTVSADAPPGAWELKLLPVADILAKAKAVKAEAPAVALAAHPDASAAPKPKAEGAAHEAPRPAEEGSRASDGFLINGSSSNASTSQFSMAAAFGNTRSSKSLYTGSAGLVFDTSALDARPYSITGLSTGKPSYNRVTGVFTFGGPINIKRFMPRGPNFFIAYQLTRNGENSTLPGLVPTTLERTGNLAGDLGAPASVAVDPVAAALLALYPLPNLAGNTLYNYQTVVQDSTHQDSMQMRLDKQVSSKNQVYGNFAFQSTRLNNTNLFGFVDTIDTLGLTLNANWQHRFGRRLFGTAGYNFSRLRTSITPEFSNRANVSGAAGIAAGMLHSGNDQDPRDWGPPTLVFSNGITSLTDGISTFNRNRTEAASYTMSWNQPKHNFTFGADFRRQEYNILAQSDPRGTYTFTGAATGNALADFLTGVPDTSSLAYGNADKYLRQTAYDAFFTDDYRALPNLTVNAGLRYEYGSPITELKNRLVNINVGTAFALASPVLASAPGLLPSSLVRPDRLGIEPRVGLSWRPIAGSTLVVRAGYGVYDDTSVYRATALAMAQQAPLSTSLDVQNSSSCPLTLAAGFRNCTGITADDFGVNPGFRVGYAQTWQLSAQRDLPASLVATVSYLGVKGTRGVQEFLPNTNPIGATDPAPTAPRGYVYRDSNGNSTRQAATVQLRRRLKSGFTSSGSYTFSKSIDDDSALGGQGPVSVGAVATSAANSGTATIAQDWRNLRGERGLSTFDQRHVANFSIQYTSGQGLGGGALMQGWRGRLLKEWTVLSSINAASGLPETPIYVAAVPGTGVTGSIRASTTGAGIYAAPAGRHLNPAAYTAPALGQWGTAGRDSIYGPGQFSLNASAARTFRLRDKLTLDLRVEATNLLNHVTFTSWNTVVNGTTFGQPVAANAMRSLQTNLRLRY